MYHNYLYTFLTTFNLYHSLFVECYLLLSISNGQPVGVQDKEYVSCVLSESVVLTVNMTSLALAVNASIVTTPSEIEE